MTNISPFCEHLTHNVSQRSDPSRIATACLCSPGLGGGSFINPTLGLFLPAISAPLGCRGSRRRVHLRRRQGLANRLRPELWEDRPQRADARRERVAVIVNSPAQQGRERAGLFFG